MQLRAHIIWFLFIAVSLRPLSARAESSTSTDQMIQQLQAQLAASQAQQVQQAQDQAQMPMPSMAPQPTPAQQQPPPQDRANKNGAAKGLAMAGAAMALLGCAKLMKDAQEAEDPETKAMLEAMAMQQCSQGMKDMADAAKNDGNKQKLTMNDSPKQAQLPTQQTPQTKPTTTTPSFPMPSDSPKEDPIAFATPTPVPEKEKSKAQLESELDNGEPEQPSMPETTALKPIPEVKLNFDENSRGGGTTPIAGLGNVYGGSSTGGQSQAGGAQKATAGAADDEAGANARRGKKGSGAAGGGDSDGGEGGSAGGKAADPFESMMSQMFGKPGDAAGPFAGFGGTGISSAASEAAAGGDKKINIFEYASFRYKQASHKEGRLKNKPARTIASLSVETPTAQAAGAHIQEAKVNP